MRLFFKFLGAVAIPLSAFLWEGFQERKKQRAKRKAGKLH